MRDLLRKHAGPPTTPPVPPAASPQFPGNTAARSLPGRAAAKLPVLSTAPGRYAPFWWDMSLPGVCACGRTATRYFAVKGSWYLVGTMSTNSDRCIMRETPMRATLLLLFSLFPVFAGDADWPRWRGPANDGMARG